MLSAQRVCESTGMLLDIASPPVPDARSSETLNMSTPTTPGWEIVPLSGTMYSVPLSKSPLSAMDLTWSHASALMVFDARANFCRELGYRGTNAEIPVACQSHSAGGCVSPS